MYSADESLPTHASPEISSILCRSNMLGNDESVEIQYGSVREPKSVEVEMQRRCQVRNQGVQCSPDATDSQTSSPWRTGYFGVEEVEGIGSTDTNVQYRSRNSVENLDFVRRNLSIQPSGEEQTDDQSNGISQDDEYVHDHAIDPSKSLLSAEMDTSVSSADIMKRKSRRKRLADAFRKFRAKRKWPLPFRTKSVAQQHTITVTAWRNPYYSP